MRTADVTRRNTGRLATMEWPTPGLRLNFGDGSATIGSPSVMAAAGSPEETRMDDRVEGTAREFGGRVQEAVGNMTGDAKTQAQGLYNQAAGQAQQAAASDQRPDQVTAARLRRWCARHSATSSAA